MRIKAGAKAGYFPFQSHGYVADGYTADLRDAIMGVRISGHVHKHPRGRRIIKKGDYGDLNGALFLQTAGKDLRPVGSFFMTGIPAIVVGIPAADAKGAPDAKTDPDHQQADNPFIVGVAGAKQGKPTTGPGKVVMGVQNAPAKTGSSTQPGSQQGTSAALLKGQVLVSVIRNAAWKIDDRYANVVASPPKDAKGKSQKMAVGQRGMLVAGTEDNSQEALFIPIDSHSLIAVNWAGNPSMGTRVFDLDGNSEVDPDRSAPLQSMMRVVKRVGAENVLAFNLGPTTGQGDTDAGAFFYGDIFDATCAWASSSRGGFISTKGTKDDSHSYGDAATGDARYEPAHLSTHALFREGATANAGIGTSDEDAAGFPDDPNNQGGIDESRHDGPLLFERRFPRVTHRAQHRVHAHLEFDPGVSTEQSDTKGGEQKDGMSSPPGGAWRWWAESFLYEPPNTETPSKNPPPPPPPPPPPGQPKYPGKIPPEGPDPGLDIQIIDNPAPLVTDLGNDPGGAIDISLLTAQDIIDNANGVADDPGFRFPPGNKPPSPVRQGVGGPKQRVPGLGPDDGDPIDFLGSFRQNNGPTIYERPWQEPRRFAAASVEVSFPATIFRAQLFRRDAPWMTNSMNAPQSALAWYDQYAPVVARLEAYGAQGGTPGVSSIDASPSGTAGGDPFDYTTIRSSGSPYPGGTANGAVCILPGEVTLVDAENDFVPSTGAPVSTAFLTIPHVSTLALGLPDLPSGGITRGWTIAVDNTGKVNFSHVDTNGVVTPEASLNSDGTITGFGGSTPSMAAIFGQTQTGGKTIGGTGTETTMIGTGVGAASIPSGWQNGMSVRVMLRGSISSKAIAPGTIRIKGKLAAATNLDTGAINVVASLATAPFDCEMILTCTDNSTPNATVFAGTLIFRSTGATPITGYEISDVSFSGTVDTTVATSVDITFQWGTSDAGNTVTTVVGKIDTETP